jgi:integrase
MFVRIKIGVNSMATIRQRKNKSGEAAKFQWQAIIEMVNRATGLTHKESNTFNTKTEALEWSRGIEADLQRKIHNDTRLVDSTLLCTLIERYKHEVTPLKLGNKQETVRLNKWLKSDLAKRPISRCLPKDFADYIAHRRSEISKRGGPVAEQTIKLEIIAISNVFEVARKDWGYEISNPTKQISMPKGSNARNVRIIPSDWEKISAILNTSHNPLYVIIAEFAIESGMRQGEIFRMTWADINLSSRTLTVYGKDTRNPGKRKVRTVPLSIRAVELLSSLKRNVDSSIPVFLSLNDISVDGLSRAFTAACNQIGLVGGCFHISRHEAASRMALHYNMLTLMKIFGWTTPSMAARYYHASDEELLAGLDKMHSSATIPKLNGNLNEEINKSQTIAPLPEPEPGYKSYAW